jgi:prephenate dehydrogenase
MNNFNGDNNDIRELLVFSFRYALGRMSFAPQIVRDIVTNNKHLLSEHDKYLMVSDIKDAIEYGRAGMGCDIATWEGLIKELND